MAHGRLLLVVAALAAWPALAAAQAPESKDKRPAAPSLLSLPPPSDDLRPPGYLLRPTSDGGYTYQTDGWRASIAPDGGVQFTDRSVVIKNLKLGPIDLLGGKFPSDRPTLQSFLRDTFRARPPPDPWAESRAPIWKYHADPRDACGPRDACYFVPMGAEGAIVSVGGIMDLTDIYMRWMKQDPYRHAKATFLAATFEMRMKMAVRRQAELTRASLAELPARLEAIWADPARPPVEKRQLLWSLWSEASDGESGRKARATIEAFIRARLPRGDADAFSDEELAHLREASHGAFAPYDH